jgi:hypothetical protein
LAANECKELVGRLFGWRGKNVLYVRDRLSWPRVDRVVRAGAAHRTVVRAARTKVRRNLDANLLLADAKALKELNSSRVLGNLYKKFLLFSVVENLLENTCIRTVCSKIMLLLNIHEYKLIGNFFLNCKLLYITITLINESKFSRVHILFKILLHATKTVAYETTLYCSVSGPHLF